MVCNTVHLYYEELQKHVKVPVIDLRKAVRDCVKKKNVKSAFVLGTSSTIKQGLYRFNDIRTLEPTLEEQKQMTDAIFLFNKGVKKEKQKAVVKEICNKYLRNGAETVILGCTEFAVMLQDVLPCINTIDVLVEETLIKSSSCPSPFLLLS